MKRHNLTRPAWFRWSNGRAFTREELKKFRQIERKTRQKGESERQWFARIRDIVEKYEAQKQRTILRKPSRLRRAWCWLTGQKAKIEIVVRI